MKTTTVAEHAHDRKRSKVNRVESPTHPGETGAMRITIKRVYEAVAADDGYRVLVDRLWPRGLTKSAAQLDLWDKLVAPSPALRRAWHADPLGHSPEHFQAFAADYRSELAVGEASTALDELAELAREHASLTLLYAAKDEQVNHAMVLRDALLERIAQQETSAQQGAARS